MYYPCSENKGADQLRSYCEADLRLLFSPMQIVGFPMQRLRFSHAEAQIPVYSCVFMLKIWSIANVLPYQERLLACLVRFCGNILKRVRNLCIIEESCLDSLVGFDNASPANAP